MRLNPFASKPPLDQESIDWIFEVFAWGLRHLEAAVFHRDTILVIPDNAHFPGRASSVPQLARLMFEGTVAYAGMSAWPLSLIEPGQALPAQEPTISLPEPLRSAGEVDASTRPPQQVAERISVAYAPKLVNNPEAMVAGFAQVMAHHLGAAVTEEPPGGVANWPQTTEVLSVFLGFGVLMANTALNYRPSSCGSCSGPPVERQVYLSQYDVTYALALFCVLKGIPNQQVLKPLKGSLRGYFKRCRRDIEGRTQALDGLRDLQAA